MTKIMLHGGYSTHHNPQNDSFYKETVEELSSGTITVLLVFFAKKEESHEELYDAVTSNFLNNSGDKELKFIKADRNDFIEQVKDTDIVYLSGGQTLKLIEILKSYPGLVKNLKDKVVIGDSAGTYALSTYFYSKSEGGLFKGLGIAPVKVICHYEGVNSEKLEELKDNLDILLLKDYEYKIYRT